jgi:zinc and cadmium transporter
MTESTSLALYTGAILAGAIAGGTLPLIGRGRRSDVGLSFSAGVMLGAAFFHMLPEAVEGAGARAAPWVVVGFLFLFLLERFVLVHVCGEPGPNERLSSRAGLDLAAAPLPHDHDHGHLHGPVHDAAHQHAHLHGDGTGCEVHTLGLAAWVGMSVHTVVDGFALGAANASAELGFLVFIAILAHKIPSSFSLSSILRSEGASRRKALLMNAAFSLMVPVGAGLYVILRETVPLAGFTSFALAASAGTFLHLALSDILPDLHRRGGSKLRLSGAMLFGLAVMWSLTLIGAEAHAH